MKYGVHTFLWTQTFAQSHLDLLPQLREQGFTGIEIARRQFEDFPIAQIGREIVKNNLECTLCSGLTEHLSLVTADLTARQQTLAFLKQAIQVAADLGSTMLVGPLVAPIGYLCGRRRTTDEWLRAVEGLQALGETLTQAGVTLALEPLNRYQTYFLNTITDGVALCDAVAHPQVGLLLDVFHANIEEKNIAQAIRQAKPHLKHIHVCENDRGTPGSGHLPWTEIFQAIRDVEYDRWLVIESFNFHDQELASGTCTWRDLAVTPEAIAYEGLEFLRQQSQGFQ